MTTCRPLVFALLAICLLTLSCSKEPALAPAQERLLTKRLTAYYYNPLAARPRTDSVQSMLFQGMDFYPLNRGQDVYEYDQQKRLTSIEARNPDRPSDTYSYYGNSTVSYDANKMTYTNLNIYPLSPSTYELNESGYIKVDRTYDQDGYMTRYQGGPNLTTTRTIEQGNIVKQVTETSIGRQTITYEYDLTKPGLPDPVSSLWWGRSSRNLLLKMTSVHESFTGVAPVMPDRIVTTYSYEFDANGMVTKQTAFAESNLMPNPTVVYRQLAISSFEFK